MYRVITVKCFFLLCITISKGHFMAFDYVFVSSQVKEDGSMEVCHIDKYSVGCNISTKAVNSDERHDLTWDYKHYDGKHRSR